MIMPSAATRMKARATGRGPAAPVIHVAWFVMTDRDPETMLEQLKSLPLLTGWRGSQPRDMDSLKEVLLRFSALVEDLPGVDQMEINPLLVFNHGRGCAAVDVRALVKPTRPA
jgi:hypothetical protein